MTEPKPTPMTRAIRKTNEREAERLRNNIARQIASRDAAVERLTAERNAKTAIDQQQLATILAALTADDAAAEKVDA